ncbi:SURF1 family protein [Nocardioides sp.]|uniref:SURF1 family cytochrome oxidase biogenesis protein n=1 Tax=Nocardioides sp. TaxID=35761 RepID=UPI0035115AE7
MGSSLTSWRFLLSRRWVLFFFAVLLIGYGTWWLGEWQFGRLADRRERNAIVETNEKQQPVPVGDVLGVGKPVAERDEWRLVSAEGEYDVARTVVVRYRTRDGAPGVEVVVPFVTEGGETFLVDRGWFGTDDPEIGPDKIPAPPSGEVTMTGWVRDNGTGESTAVDSDRSTRAIASGPIGRAIDRELLNGFVALRSESPEPATALEPVELPDLGEGPHFFYGLQWWFFGLLATFGFGYLAWDERQNGPRKERVAAREPSERQKRREIRRRQIAMTQEKARAERAEEKARG